MVPIYDVNSLSLLFASIDWESVYVTMNAWIMEAIECSGKVSTFASHVYIYRKENELIFPRGWRVYKISNIYWNLWQQFHSNGLANSTAKTWSDLVQRARPRYTYITMQIGFDDFGKFLTKFYHQLLSMHEFLTFIWVTSKHYTWSTLVQLIAAVHELHVHVCIENMDTYILRPSRLKYG